jgi:hypothetical protein
MRRFSLGLCVLCLLAGCSSKPSRVTAPPISGNAAADAIKKLDKNGDGGIDAEEAKTGAPGLFEVDAMTGQGSKTRIDANGDGKVTADEINARINKWAESKIGLTQFSVGFTLDGAPLEGAEVKLVPEDWLGTEVKPGTGKTDASGRATVTIAPQDLKPNEQQPTPLQGMRLGIYKIEVTHPSRPIPAKYNTATELGIEIAPDDPNQGRKTFALTSS